MEVTVFDITSVRFPEEMVIASFSPLCAGSGVAVVFALWPALAVLVFVLLLVPS